MSLGRVTSGMLSRNVLADLNEVSARVARTQAKLSSGAEITKPSDDPFGASRAVTLRSSLEGTRQHQRNVEDAKGWQDATESALARMTEVVQRAQELVIQGGSDTSSADSRGAIAVEVDQLIESLKQQANTTYRGKALFSGTRTDVRPYLAGDTFGGNTAMVAREIGPGVSMQINVDAQDILGNGQAAGDDKLLDILRDVSEHLRAGDSASLRGTDLERLGKGLDKIVEVRALNGARTNRLEAAMTRLTEVEELTGKQLGDIESADMAKTIIDLNSQQAAYQAALKAGANIVQASLMDFLR